MTELSYSDWLINVVGPYEEKEAITKNPLLNCCYCHNNENGTFFSLFSPEEGGFSQFLCVWQQNVRGEKREQWAPSGEKSRPLLYNSAMSAELDLKLPQFLVLSVLDPHPAKQLSIWDRSQRRGTPELHKTQTPREELVLISVLWFRIECICRISSFGFYFLWWES